MINEEQKHKNKNFTSPLPICLLHYYYDLGKERN